jgi:hypothetical protein
MKSKMKPKGQAMNKREKANASQNRAWEPWQAGKNDPNDNFAMYEKDREAKRAAQWPKKQGTWEPWQAGPDYKARAERLAEALRKVRDLLDEDDYMSALIEAKDALAYYERSKWT